MWNRRIDDVQHDYKHRHVHTLRHGPRATIVLKNKCTPEGPDIFFFFFNCIKAIAGWIIVFIFAVWLFWCPQKLTECDLHIIMLLRLWAFEKTEKREKGLTKQKARKGSWMTAGHIQLCGLALLQEEASPVSKGDPRRHYATELNCCWTWREINQSVEKNIFLVILWKKM